MCEWWEVHMYHGWAPWRYLWESHRWTSSLIKGCSSRVLLPDHRGGLHKVRTAVQIVSTTRRLASCAPGGVTINPQPMAFQHMGDWYLGSVSLSISLDEVPGGSHWVLHQVDRSRAHRTDHSPQGSTLFMEEHSLLFWNPKAFSVWQWYPVCKSSTIQIMHRAQHQAGVRLSRTPLDEWAGRIC